ncbi:uncharacterized protein [Dermacentor albipictus]|uniref:uncharacterized protein isoform X2 n=1 Tax=Dermacentor albipictus TaxID=60249 RepID=UPI0031FD516A
MGGTQIAPGRAPDFGATRPEGRRASGERGRVLPAAILHLRPPDVTAAGSILHDSDLGWPRAADRRSGDSLQVRHSTVPSSFRLRAKPLGRWQPVRIQDSLDERADHDGPLPAQIRPCRVLHAHAAGHVRRGHLVGSPPGLTRLVDARDPGGEHVRGDRHLRDVHLLIHCTGRTLLSGLYGRRARRSHRARTGAVRALLHHQQGRRCSSVARGRLGRLNQRGPCKLHHRRICHHCARGHPLADFTAAGYTGGHVLRESEQADVLPYSLHYLVPVYAAAMGLAAIASSVFSSVDASALSAASLFARNIYFNFLRPNASSEEMAAAARMSVCLLGAVTAAMALDAQSVYIMRSLCADIIYVLLFPQLLCLFYLAELTNTYGVLAGFLVGLLTRTLCGEPLINVPVIISPPLYRTFCMVASLSCTVGVSYAYQTLFARRLLADFLGCFVVVGQDDRGRYLVRSGLGSVSEPLPSRGAAAATKADSPARTVAPDSNSKEPRPDAGTPVPPTNSTGRPGSGPRADCATPAVAAEAALSQTPRASTIVTPRGSAAVPSVVTPGPYAFLTGLAESAKQHTSRVAAMVGAYDQHQGLDSAAETISDTSKLTNVTADPEPRKTFAFTPKQPKADRSRSASSLKKGTRLRRPSSRSSSSTSTKSKSQKQKA